MSINQSDRTLASLATLSTVMVYVQSYRKFDRIIVICQRIRVWLQLGTEVGHSVVAGANKYLYQKLASNQQAWNEPHLGF